MMMPMVHEGDVGLAQMAANVSDGVIEATLLPNPRQIQLLVAGPNAWAGYVATYERLMALRGTPVTVVTEGATAWDVPGQREAVDG